MSKNFMLLTVCAAALLAVGGYVVLNKNKTVADKPVAHSEKMRPVPQKTDGKDIAQPKIDSKKPIETVPSLSASCKASLSDEKIYDKLKLQSYATILPGKNGWFFRNDTDFRQDFAMDEKGVEGFQAITKALQDKGITLIVAIIPPKGIVMPENMPDDVASYVEFDAPKALQSYKDMIAQMRAAGVNFVGVDSFDSEKPFFLRADQHWSQAGTDRMAKAIADYVKTLPVYQELPKQKFETVIKGPFSYQGKYTEALRKICGVTTANENDVQAVTSPAQVQANASDLFDDKPVPKVVLVGTSNSKREYDSNFDGALKQYLETDVVNDAIAGVGYDDPFLIYLSSPEFKTNPPKLIVWEIPGYYDMSGGKDVYKTIPASVWGDCGTAAVATKDINDLSADKVTLFDIKDGDKIPANTYLVMNFDKPVKKKFTVSLYADKDTSQRVKFEVSKRTSDRLIFMTDMPYATTSKIIMNVPKDSDGTKLQVRLCAKPAP